MVVIFVILLFLKRMLGMCQLYQYGSCSDRTLPIEINWHVLSKLLDQYWTQTSSRIDPPKNCFLFGFFVQGRRNELGGERKREKRERKRVCVGARVSVCAGKKEEEIFT